MNRNKLSAKHARRLPLAVIFDVDGVLLESEPFMRQAATQMFAEKGLSIKTEDFTPFIGVGEGRFISCVAEKYNIKMDVASSSDLEKVLKNFEAIGLDVKLFDAVVSGDYIERKKPNPDIFLLAAEKMGLKGCECLVVEDAVNGIAATHAAGAKCLALATSFNKDELSRADWVQTIWRLYQRMFSNGSVY